MRDPRDPQRPVEESLRAWLRAGDPAGDGAGLSPTDVARLRRSLRDAAPARGARWSLLPALTAAGGLGVLVVLGALVAQRQPEPQPRLDENELATLASPPLVSRRSSAAHQIQFTTARGTRVIWTLTSDREVER